MFLTFNSHLIARLQALTSTWWCCTAAVQIACCVHCLFWVWSIVSPSPWESTLGSLPQSCFPIIELVRCCLLWVLLLREFFTSFYPSSEGSMRSTLLHPPIIPHYDHSTPVIHTVTHLLDPLLHASTMGENRDFWLLRASLIFQVISWKLDVNLLKLISLKIQWQIARYFRFVLWVI